MDNNTVAIDEVSSEKDLETLQNVDNSIVKITESIQAHRCTKHKLNLIENKSPEVLKELEEIETVLEQELKELDECFQLASRLLTQIQDQTFKLINDKICDTGENAENVVPQCESTGEFHKFMILNRDEKSKDKTPPHIVVLEQKHEIREVCCNNSIDDSNLSSCCSKQSTDPSCCVIKCPLEVEPSCDSNKVRLKFDICELKEELKKIVFVNHELRFELNASIKRNHVLEQSLQRPAPFKSTTDGDIRFPGRKEMEEKLLTLKTDILKLHADIREVKTAHIKLKSAKEFISQYNDAVVSCQCDNPSFKNNIDQTIKIKNEQIQCIGGQLKNKNNELCAIINNYDTTNKTHQKNSAKLKKLSDNVHEMVAYLKSIGEYRYGDEEDSRAALISVNEDIEASELVIKERQNELHDINEKLNEIKRETKTIIEKTDKMEMALNNLSKDFTTTYTNLESIYQEQLEEMMALPKILKATHVKLQEETDMRVLAEETRDKLENEIRELEANKKIAQSEDDTEKEIKLLKRETIDLESKIKYFDASIKSATEELDKELKEYETINHKLDLAVAESTKHINASKKFSTMHTDRITFDIMNVQELLMELQSKQCEKAIIKTTVVDNLKSKLDSINQTVKECKKEMGVILCETQD